MAETVLELDDLTVRFRLRRGDLTAVEGVSFSIAAGETLGLVGESGSGKSVTARSIMRLIGAAGAICRPHPLRRRELLAPSDRMRRVRGRASPWCSRTDDRAQPGAHIGRQIAEALAPIAACRAAARARAVEMLRGRHPRAASAARQLSAPTLRRHAPARDDRHGARAASPALLIADEPTTALDVTIQAQILELLARAAASDCGMAILFITHDLGVVAEPATASPSCMPAASSRRRPARRSSRSPRIPTRGPAAIIPRARRPQAELPDAHPGQVPRHRCSLPAGCPFHPRCPHVMDVCRGDAPELSDDRAGPRARATSRRRRRTLVTAGEIARCRPRCSRSAASSSTSPSARRLLGWPAADRHAERGRRRRSSTSPRRDAGPGRRVGCGKSTVGARLVAARRADRRRGHARRRGPRSACRRGALRPRAATSRWSSRIPTRSLNPRMTVVRHRSPSRCAIHGWRRGSRAAQTRRRAARRVGLDAEHMRPLSARVLRRPAPAHRHRPRARARARALIADEPVSALDVSIQAQILNLLRDLQERARPDLPLHRPRPRRRPPHHRPRRGDVSRQDRRDGPDRRRSSRRRCTPTPRRCWRPFPRPIPSSAAAQAPAEGRGADADRPAAGLPAMRPLSAVSFRFCAESRAAAGRSWQRPSGRLPQSLIIFF